MTSNMDDPQPCPGFLCLPTGHVTFPASSSQTELGTFCGDRREEAVTLWTEAWTQDGLPSSCSLGWHQGPGVEPCEDLGLSPMHLATSSSPANAGTWLPVLRTQAITPLLGNFPLLQMVTEGGCPGWGRPPVHILRTNPPDINSRWFRFYFNFFVLIFLIRIFILSTFILKEFVLCIGGAGSRAEGMGPWDGQGSEGLPSPGCSLLRSLSSSVLSNTVKY